MIKYSSAQWISKLQDMWQSVFHDSKQYVDLYFKYIYTDENTLIDEEDGTLAAMLYMVPYDIRLQRQKYKAMYLYALATHADYRKQGRMEQLINQAVQIAKERGVDYIFLVPASDALFNYYRKFEFKVPMTRTDFTLSFSGGNIHSVPKKPLILNPATTDEIGRAYALSDYHRMDGILPTNQQNEMFLKDLELQECDAWIFQNDNAHGYALTGLEADMLVIYETDVSAGSLISLCSELRKHYEFARLKICQPFNIDKLCKELSDYQTFDELCAFESITKEFALGMWLSKEQSQDLSSPFFMNRLLV
jgi:predicted acetyltransferase